MRWDEEQSSEGVYGPKITKETKSKATMVFTSVLKYWYKYTKLRGHMYSRKKHIYFQG